MAKKRRNRNRPPKGAVILYQSSPESKWINQWTIPKGSAAYFSMSSDDDFKRAHPIGYGFLVALGLFALMAPFIAYNIYAGFVLSANSAWMVLGWIGAFIIGIGLFNFVAILIKQYLGHLLSILCLVVGGIMVAISLYLL